MGPKLRRTLLAGLMACACAQPAQGWAHAEHHSEGGVPTLKQASNLPKGVDVSVVQTTAYQFALATNGQHAVDILDERGKPFLRVRQGQVEADVNNPSWYRAQQPGGGAIPAAVKSGKLPPRWTTVQQADGIGWYDARLMDETRKAFKLVVRIDGQAHTLRVAREAEKPVTGFWQPKILTVKSTDNPGLADQLLTVIPGLSGHTLMVSVLPGTEGGFEVLDNQMRAFARLGPDGALLNRQHPWSSELGLFPRPEQSAEGWSEVSNSNTLAWQDPRLKVQQPGKPGVQRWTIPLRHQPDGAIVWIEGESSWQKIR
ncbi:hypothetical protein NQT62_10435 [Limnobacter humi]|uniref:Uncharacterized protein n=1 Tax=Limnobacter humi TaxID=1778671 RepID=A0ABT1WH57_9BURK|nr:hypothetical protein [Limnobacter humi]MCQ8896846.1 hypothetical protein [Limnobacter humi]